jgi:hypothetical protein
MISVLNVSLIRGPWPPISCLTIHGVAALPRISLDPRYAKTNAVETLVDVSDVP